MNLVRQIYSPAIGKAGELRSTLEEATRNFQEKGYRVNLYLKVVSDDGPTLVVNSLYENLEALEKARDQLLSDPAYRESQEKVAPLIRKPLGVELFNNLVLPSVRPVQGRYVLRTLGYPAPDKVALVGSIATEFVKSRQAERPYIRLWRQIFGSQGVVFDTVDSFETLAEYENVANNPSPTVQAAVAQVTSLSRAPIVQELYEVLIPFQS